MTPPLRTDRLILRPLELADAEQVQQLFPQWEIVRLLNARIPWPFPHDGVLSYYQRDALPAMERGDEWHWTLRLHTNPSRILGAIGLFRKGDDNRGFWLDPAMQGNGLMTEAVIAVTDFWFDVLHFAQHLPSHRHVGHPDHGTRFRLRPSARRSLGDHCRPLASVARGKSADGEYHQSHVKVDAYLNISFAAKPFALPYASLKRSSASLPSNVCIS
jgi:RimJ/RimL family protein N-acetyltransferase